MDLQRTKSRIGILLLLGTLASLGAVLAYVYRFGIRLRYEVSDQPLNWAAFGDYLGGVLGPLLSFLAFVGVLLTVWLQSIQMDTQKKQAQLEEIQRVLATVSSRIDEVLDQDVSTSLPVNSRTGKSLFHLISMAGTGLLTHPITEEAKPKYKALVEQVERDAAAECRILGIELNQLAWCLRTYRQAGGSETVMMFYTIRYQAIVTWLDAMGFMNSHPAVHEYFDLPFLRKVMAVAPGDAVTIAGSAFPNPLK